MIRSDSTAWMTACDPVAAALLKFPEFLAYAEGSDVLLLCQIMQRFTKIMRHLVISVDNPDWRSSEAGWEWPLKIDWESLPHLETLCLDLQSYSRRDLSLNAESEDEYDKKVIEGAQRMKSLNLKRLISVGLCSGPFYGKTHKHKVETLFRDLVRQGGSIEFWDKMVLPFPDEW